MNEKLADSIKALKQLVAPCDAKPRDHDWHNCTRCIAMFELDSRQPFTVQLIQTAIDELERVQKEKR